MGIRVGLFILGLGLNNIGYTQSIFPMKHVIANKTTDMMSYHFHFLGDAACDSSDMLKPGHIKQVDCQSGGLFKSGAYRMDFEQVYFYGKRKVRCSGSKTYQVKEHKKLTIWKLSKRCQLDIIDT